MRRIRRQHVPFLRTGIIRIPTVLLILFFLLGVLLGRAAALRCCRTVEPELQRILSQVSVLKFPEALTPEALTKTLVCYFRVPVLAWILGFSAVGVVGIPLLALSHGFFLSFSLLSFSCTLGREGFGAVLLLFSLRLFLLLPISVCLYADSLSRSCAVARQLGTGTKRTDPSVGIRSAGAYCLLCILLLLGAAAELCLLPTAINIFHSV